VILRPLLAAFGSTVMPLGIALQTTVGGSFDPIQNQGHHGSMVLSALLTFSHVLQSAVEPSLLLDFQPAQYFFHSTLCQI
jgi:hypothetical protein